ncbi:MAG: hypothetical protein JRK53_20375, partial [Deltaproteobacteria bacterium]|nr:hypothetical protein [Deltaproteobacteria bacterium]
MGGNIIRINRYGFRIGIMLIAFAYMTPYIAFGENARPGVFEARKVVIDRKGKDRVFISERAVIITENTVILADKKKEKEPIEFSELAVPCRVKLTYRLPMDADPVALEIVVERILKEASI